MIINTYFLMCLNIVTLVWPSKSWLGPQKTPEPEWTAGFVVLFYRALLCGGCSEELHVIFSSGKSIAGWAFGRIFVYLRFKAFFKANHFWFDFSQSVPLPMRSCGGVRPCFSTLCMVPLNIIPHKRLCLHDAAPALQGRVGSGLSTCSF